MLITAGARPRKRSCKSASTCSSAVSAHGRSALDPRGGSLLPAAAQLPGADSVALKLLTSPHLWIRYPRLRLPTALPLNVAFQVVIFHRQPVVLGLDQVAD